MGHPLVRRLLLGSAFSALGSGLTMPFLYVYFAQVRGIPTATVGLIFAWMGVVSFLFAPIGGTLIDRFGPRIVMVCGLIVEAAAVGSIGFLETVQQALIVTTAVCIGTIGLYPATTALLTRLVPEAERERVYGFQFMLMNAGLGVGGMISSFVIDVGSVASFQRLYLIDALSYVGYIVIIATLPRGTGRLVEQADLTAAASDATMPGGWRVVLADRTLLRVVAVSTVVITFGYAQMETGFAAYVTEQGGVPASRLGWAYAANTAVIVLGQLVALRFIQGRSRSRMLALAAAGWSVSWVVIGGSGLVEGPGAIALAVIGLGLFGIGETIWAPVAPSLINDLAVEELRGRYNALQAMTWTVASIIGPAFAGLLIGNRLAGVWVVSVVAGTAVAAVLFLRLAAHLTAAQDGRVAAGEASVRG
ncbi:MAG: MFS transporter [Candidatus Phosphoribacter sp.]|nr:MFS transporter [Actinomycetales bacterium]